MGGWGRRGRGEQQDSNPWKKTKEKIYIFLFPKVFLLGFWKKKTFFRLRSGNEKREPFSFGFFP